MTYRDIVGYGLIAGLTYAEIRSSQPGFILDMYMIRQKYDDVLHGVKRQKGGYADG